MSYDAAPPTRLKSAAIGDRVRLLSAASPDEDLIVAGLHDCGYINLTNRNGKPTITASRGI